MHVQAKKHSFPGFNLFKASSTCRYQGENSKNNAMELPEEVEYESPDERKSEHTPSPEKEIHLHSNQPERPYLNSRCVKHIWRH